VIETLVVAAGLRCQKIDCHCETPLLAVGSSGNGVALVSRVQPGGAVSVDRCITPSSSSSPPLSPDRVTGTLVAEFVQAEAEEVTPTSGVVPRTP
jgi:hypothetical protein